MSASPFAAWMPMHSPDAHPERPWWLRWGWVEADPTTRGWRRCDGAADSDPVAYDAQHPLPAPPPMSGQVWVFPDGRMRPVGTVWPGPRPKDDMSFDADVFTDDPWPPPGAVLVYGPTPWGFVAWAPPGWTP